MNLKGKCPSCSALFFTSHLHRQLETGEPESTLPGIPPEYRPFSKPEGQREGVLGRRHDSVRERGDWDHRRQESCQYPQYHPMPHHTSNPRVLL